LEPHSGIAIPRRESDIGKRLAHLLRGTSEVALGLDVAARGHKYICHGQRAPADAGRSALVRSTTTPTSRDPRIAPGLLTETRIHCSENSSRISIAMRCARVSTSLNSEASTNAMTRFATDL